MSALVTLAIELAPFNIHVNAIAPGWIETRMTAPVKTKPPKSYREREEKFLEYESSSSPGLQTKACWLTRYGLSQMVSFTNQNR